MYAAQFIWRTLLHGHRHVIYTLEQQTILSFPSGLTKVTLEVLFLLKKTVLQLALYNYQMRGISEAGSGPYCLVSEQSVVKKETAAAYYFFQQNYYLESERGLL